MKTINFELSKKLNDLGLLDNIETEFVYVGEDTMYDTPVYDSEGMYEYTDSIIIPKGFLFSPYTNIFNRTIKYDLWNVKNKIKTLTLEEAIEFLNNKDYILKFRKDNDKRLKYNYYIESNRVSIYPSGNSYIECIEQLLEHLLDNNLL